MNTKFKSILKHIYEKKVRYSGLLITLLYLVDQIFNISERCNLSSGWVITSVTILFLMIGYAINAKRANDDTNVFEDYIQEQKELYKSDVTEPQKDNKTSSNQASNNESNNETEPTDNEDELKKTDSKNDTNHDDDV